MPHTRYIVVQHKDEWLIKLGDEEYGPYDSQAEAMLFAIDAAQKLGEQGQNTQVGSMGEHGRFRPEWSYGQGSLSTARIIGNVASGGRLVERMSKIKIEIGIGLGSLAAHQCVGDRPRPRARALAGSSHDAQGRDHQPVRARRE